jgi:hypothetical protein
MNTDQIISQQAEDIIRHHLYRMEHEFKKQPGFAITNAIAKKLLRTDVLTFTLKTMTNELPESFNDNSHHWQSRKFSDLCLIVSIVPALESSEARTYFQGRCLAFVEDQLRDIGGEFGQNNIVHWILCSDGNKMGVHMTIIPAGQDGLFLFALEMMTEEEKARLGL